MGHRYIGFDPFLLGKNGEHNGLSYVQISDIFVMQADFYSNDTIYKTIFDKGSSGALLFVVYLTDIFSPSRYHHDAGSM